MDAEELKQDVVAGRLSVDELVEMVAELTEKLGVAYKRINELEQRINELEQRINELEQRINELEQQLDNGSTPKLEEHFSVESEEQRQQ